MFKKLRTILFWVHLVVGLSAGLIVAVMSATGGLMAFEPQLLEWVERDRRRVDPPAPGAARLPLEQVLERVAAARPGSAPAAVTVFADPTAAVQVTLGRREGVHVDPYRGDVRPFGAAALRRVMQVAIEWHRYLGATGENRPVGRALTGAANLLFLFLGLSGLYLWWPRRWSDRALRLSLWFRRGLSGKTRDFNWHNVIGFWSLSVLIVLTASGMMISYSWVSNLIPRLTGDPIPTTRGPVAAPVPLPDPPTPSARPLPMERLFVAAGQHVPAWKSITWRVPAGAPGSGRRVATTLSVKPAAPWPLFATVSVSLHPFTGRVVRAETHQDFNLARRIRSWLRFLHTGEALGWPGQLVAGVVSLAATVLVWTGFALAWRRLVPRRRRAAPDDPSPPAATR
jgi:uncharacterized iron-regulated membrane protein